MSETDELFTHPDATVRTYVAQNVIDELRADRDRLAAELERAREREVRLCDALADAIGGCFRCDGTGLMVGGTRICPRCGPERELLAAARAALGQEANDMAPPT